MLWDWHHGSRPMHTAWGSQSLEARGSALRFWVAFGLVLFTLGVRAGTAEAVCPGDCDGDNIVDVADLVTGVEVTLGRESLEACRCLDANGDGRVSISEPIAAVQSSLGGCPPPPTATSTVTGTPPTATATRTPTPTTIGPTATPTVTPTRPAGNVAPTIEIVPPGNKTATLGATLSFTALATDANCPAPGDDCNPDNPAVNPLAVSFAPVPLPRGATYNATVGQFTFRPAPDQVGNYFVTFTASDGTLSAQQGVMITVPPPSGTTTLRGAVLTAGNQPLANVRLVLGTSSPREVFTGADGTFLFENIPGFGRQRLLVDGSTVNPALGTFATVPEVFDIIAGGDNVVDPPIFLLPLDVASGDPVSPAADAIVTSSPIMKNGQMFQPIELRIPAGAARMEDTGEMFDGIIHITSVPDPSLGPRPLPDDIGVSVYIAVQPFGVEYPTPVEIAFPNVDNFPPNSVVDIFGLDHDTGAFEKVGDGLVGFDGMVRSGHLNANGTFTPGGVVRNNSWHGFTPRPPQSETDDSSDDPEDETTEPADWDENSRVGIRNGNLEKVIEIAAYFSAGIRFSFKLEYNSTTAYPFPLVSRFWTPGNLTPPPAAMSSRLVLGGQSGAEIFRSADFCTLFNCPLVRFPVYADARSFPTGEYPADYTLNCVFTPTTFRSDTKRQNVQVINEMDSPMGAGWNVWGHEHVHRTATGKLMITNGTSSADVFTPALQALADISRPGETDFYRFVGSVGETVSIEMRRRSNQHDGSGSLDPTIELWGPFGIQLARDDDGGTSTVGGPGADAAILNFPLPASGEYTLRARGAGGTAGPYQLLFTTLSDTPLVSGFRTATDVSPDIRFEDAIGSINAVRSHDFVANAGDEINVDVLGLAGDNGRRTLDPVVDLVEVRGGQRIVLHRDDDGGSNEPPGPGRNARIRSFSLPNTGAYALEVRGGNQTTGPYEVQVSFGTLNGGIQFDGGVGIERVVVSEPGDFSWLKETDEGFERWFPNGLVKYFDQDGHLLREAQRNGNTMRYEYEGDLLSAIVDFAGQTTHLEYEDGWLARVIDPAGRETALQHDSDGNLTMVRDPGGGEHRFEYDDRHLLMSAIGPREFATTHSYDFTGRLLGSENPDGSTRGVVSAQSAGGLPAPNPNTCGTARADLGCPDNLAPAATESTPEYVDGRGNRRTYDVDEGGLPTAIRLPESIDHLFDYRNRLPVLYTRPNGSQVSASWDDQGNLRRVVEDSIGAAVQMDYGEHAEILRITDALGGAVSFAYDDLGLLIEAVLQNGTRNLFFYDEPGLNPSPVRGLLTRAVWAAGTDLESTTIYAYDVRGLLVRLEEGGHAHRFDYDAAGNRIEIEAGDKRTFYGYDLLNHLVSVTHVGLVAGTVNVRFELDLEGNIVVVTDGEDNTTTAEYDGCNRPTTVVDDAGRSELFEYDDDGNLARYVDRAEHDFGFDWDAVGRLRQKLVAGVVIRSFTYSSLDLITSITDSSSRLLLDYDVLGRLRQASTEGSPCQPDVTLDYTFDASGNVLSLVDPIGTTTYDYNAANRLVRLVNPSNEEVRFGYDLWQRPTGIEFPSLDLHRRFGYDAQSRVLSVLNAVDDGNLDNGIDTVVSAFEYGRDDHGNVVGLDQDRPAIDVPARLDYGYDEWNRLTFASAPLAGLADEQYGYDEAGNRDDAQVNGLNEILENARFTFEHDANGNVARKVDKTTKAATVYTHDAENRLARVDLPDGGFIEYDYDGLGRRIKKNVNGVVTEYVYDGWNVLFAYDGAEDLLARYTPGPCDGEFLILERDEDDDDAFAPDERFFFTADALHSTTELVSRAGDVTSAYVYGAFGQDVAGAKRSAVLDGVANDFRYRGLMYEPLTGLYHYRGRDYDPETGRFLQRKTIAGLLGAPKTLHPYRFAFNNPVSSPLIDLGRPGLRAQLRRLAGGADVATALRRSGGTPPWLQVADDVDGEALAPLVLDATRGTKQCQPAFLERRGSLLFEEETSIFARVDFNFDFALRLRLLGGKPRPRRAGNGLLPGLNVLDLPRGAAIGAGVGGLFGRDDGATVGGLLGEGGGASNAPAPKKPF